MHTRMQFLGVFILDRICNFIYVQMFFTNHGYDFKAIEIPKALVEIVIQHDAVHKNKVLTIKAIKAVYNLSLREAKDIVDHMVEQGSYIVRDIQEAKLSAIRNEPVKEQGKPPTLGDLLKAKLKENRS